MFVKNFQLFYASKKKRKRKAEKRIREKKKVKKPNQPDSKHREKVRFVGFDNCVTACG